MIPKPPIQCIMLRQKRSPCESPSMSAKMVAPVVVNPLMASKKASARGMRRCRMKGIMPMMEKSTQESVTTRKLSARVRCFSVLFFPIDFSVLPTAKAIRALVRNASPSSSA